VKKKRATSGCPFEATVIIWNNKTNILEWAGLRRSIPLSLRSYDRYPYINSPTFVVGDNNFDVTKGKSKDYYNLLVREKAKPPNIITE